MAVFTILVDRREQKPWLFENYPVDTREVTLETGDYTIAELCEYNDEYDTCVPSLAVERKSGPDLLQSITHEHARFRREIVRAEDWDEPLQIYVEEPWGTFMNNRRFMDYRDVSPAQVNGIVTTMGRKYNADFNFYSDRQRAEQAAFDKLMTWYRAEQYSPASP